MSDHTNPTPHDPDEFGSNDWLVDQMHEQYLADPSQLSETWRAFFDSGGVSTGEPSVTPTASEKPLPPVSIPPPPPPVSIPPPPPSQSQETPRAPEPSQDPLAGLPEGSIATPLKGVPGRIADAMTDSLRVPTATSFRTFPSKLLEVNRRILNNQLARLTKGGKVSFTHLIGWATVKALAARPAMGSTYREVGNKSFHIQYNTINLGLAMDVPGKDGSRSLIVPNIKGADQMTFREFWEAYEDIVRRARSNKITVDDFAGTTATLTNPGTVGTVQSVPRLMPGQGVIIGVGRIGYAPEFEGSDPDNLARSGVGRTLTMSSTYDHRVIQGAESGMLLRHIHELLLGAEDFYDEVFESMRIPYVPARWAVDSNPPAGSGEWAEKQAKIFHLINMYRSRGHLIANLDPLNQNPPNIHPELDPLTYGLTIWDLDRDFATGGLADSTHMKLGNILGVLRDAYCRTAGIEYMHIHEPTQKVWIQDHLEGKKRDASRDEKLRVLEKLNQAEAFEHFLHTKFLGAKRFSLEGCEATIPLLDTLLSEAAEAGMVDVSIGMAHRGRLNVLANIIGKSLVRMFSEFTGNIDAPLDEGFSGDVKYHLGAHGTHVAPSGATVGVDVAANPSHLEAVDPVLEGMVRAKQDALGEDGKYLVLPVLIHGDAAFSGQGVVGETLNLSQLHGYATGGTVHIIINNQVGFTTAARDARSSHYATDVAKTVEAPIFHVNGDDPEAVARVAKMAFAFRQAFKRDVVVDLIGYRRLGHNEGDEPSFTQPKMYRIINSHATVRELYLERLVASGDLSPGEAEAIQASFRSHMDDALKETKSGSVKPESRDRAAGTWDIDTTVARDLLDFVERRARALPDSFEVHPKLAKTLDGRAALYASGQLDWALGESLAWGSLSMEGVRVRLAGEDSKRGTFSHRHASLVDFNTEQEWIPLQHLDEQQAQLRIYDSLLSEFAAMGFEYGYSVQAPDSLVMWEGQFGDFVNGAQVIIDQFIMSGEDKWSQPSSLVLLLPHGFEGQGPEHSSARLERFLQNAAENNVRVVVPSTPAQHFHMMRRQALAREKKPLIVMSPKSLLRTKDSYSSLEDLTDTGFQKVILDRNVKTGARRVVLCQGKVYYELARYQAANNITDVTVVRVEQLYPFPAEEIKAAIAPHDGGELVWLQEEPANMGAWRFMSRYLYVEAGLRARGIYRKESSSPATGHSKVHAAEQKKLIDRAFAP
jgi:multifunctional 2-oxoglutarate metabolism enzyme